MSGFKRASCYMRASEGARVPKPSWNREKKTDKQETHKGIWWLVHLGSVPGTVCGRVPGQSERPDLISVESHIDWTECLWDKRDISTGWLRSKVEVFRRSSLCFFVISLLIEST